MTTWSEVIFYGCAGIGAIALFIGCTVACVEMLMEDLRLGGK